MAGQDRSILKARPQLQRKGLGNPAVALWPERTFIIDDEEIKDIEKKMQDCITRMRSLTVQVGKARQVKEFSSDQRKNALAEIQMTYIHRGESVASSETSARANPLYLEKLRNLETSYAEACATIADWEAVFARFEACRSMLAMARSTLGL